MRAECILFTIGAGYSASTVALILAALATRVFALPRWGSAVLAGVLCAGLFGLIMFTLGRRLGIVLYPNRRSRSAP